MNSFTNLFTFLLLLISITVSSAIVGKWEPIGNVNDPKIQELAKFALTEHNNEVKGKEAILRFEKVLSGEKQVVSGVNYKLILAACSGDGKEGKEGKYEAIVWVKEWEKFKKLTSFRSV